jgi:large subunit ribosomal protein L29
MATKTKAKAKSTELSAGELQTRLRDLKQESLNLRLQQATGQLENPARIRVVRRETARVLTALAAAKRKA